MLRSRHPDAEVASICLAQLTKHYADFVKNLPEKPILIGHSMGGLLTQRLVNRDLAVADVAIHSVPPQGIIPLSLSFFKATWGPLGFFTDVKKTFPGRNHFVVGQPTWQEDAYFIADWLTQI